MRATTARIEAVETYRRPQSVSIFAGVPESQDNDLCPRFVDAVSDDVPRAPERNDEFPEFVPDGPTHEREIDETFDTLLKAVQEPDRQLLVMAREKSPETIEIIHSFVDIAQSHGRTRAVGLGASGFERRSCSQAATSTASTPKRVSRNRRDLRKSSATSSMGSESTSSR
jgi:hypothetical protein